MPNPPKTVAELIDLLRKSGVASQEQLASISGISFPDNPNKAAAMLVAQGAVTRFQVQQLLAGRFKGFRVGSYVVQDLLGRGGMGAVYLAEHLELHRKVAIKVLVPGKDEDHKLALERFLREARAAAALDHPNIVRIFDVARHNDAPYLVMEYVEGETLQQALDRDGAIPFPLATEFIAQAAAGLQHAHEKGFVHRDIKPSNLIRDKGGTIKILDMGLARSSSKQDNLTEKLDHGAVVGTADFIAPEQGLNQPGIDIRADIYALGATFFSLLIGKPPFQGNTTQKLLQHQLRSAPTLESLDMTLPKGLSAVVARMLAKKPQDRFQTPGEVIAALAPWMGNSAQLYAGLSRTNLAQGVNLQATLSENGRGSSRRLAAATLVDSGEVDTSGTAQETRPVSASITTREPSRTKTTRRAVKATMPRKKIIVLASIGVVVLVTGGLAGWLAFGRERKQDNPPAADNRPRSEQENKPNGSLPPKTETPIEREVFKFDAASLPAFRTTKEGFKKTSGDDTPKLKGVYLAGWKMDSITEWECATVAGSKALGFTNINEANSAQIGMDLEKADGAGLKFEPGQKLRMRIVYRTAGMGRGQAYFQTFNDWKVINRVELPNSNDEWKTVELDTTRGDKALRCLVETSETGAGNTLYIRSVILTDIGKGKPPASSPPVTPPTPTPADNPASWTEGTNIYTLEIAKIPAFRVVKEQFNRTSGDAESLPTGIGCQSWRENAIGEFRCEKLDGIPALGVINLNDEKSGQFFFQIEGDMMIALQPGKAYRVKVAYMTKNDAAGNMTMQVTPGYKGIASAGFANSDGKWKNATMSFIRPPADDKVEVRMTIDNTTVGEGNILWVRSLEIVELVPPGKK
jgi:eukaryotic-like serine/threonine-protein kinase